MRSFATHPCVGPEDEAVLGKALEVLGWLEERSEELEEGSGLLPKALRELAARGLMGITAPKEVGGLGRGARALALVAQALSEASASTAFSLVAHHLALSALVVKGVEGAVSGYVRRMTQGELGAFALTEPGAGSDISSLGAVAEPRGDRYLLRGVKTFVTNGLLANVFVVFANVPGTGLTAFVIDKEAEGLRLRRQVSMGCLRGCGMAEIVLEGVEVPSENVVEGVGKGLSVATRALAVARLGVAAVALGLSHLALKGALAFASTRTVLGQRLSESQAVRSALSHAYAKVMAAEALVYDAACLLDRGEDASAKIAAAKLIAVETATEVTEEALKLMGGYGVLEEGRLWRAFKDARCLRAAGGVPEVLKATIFKGLVRGVSQAYK